MATVNSQQNISIGQLAAAVEQITGLRCTPAMIYNYEKLGLLPSPERSAGGVRKFNLRDLALVVRIKRGLDEGLSLATIKTGLEDGSLPDADFQSVPHVNSRKAIILDAAAQVFPQNGYLQTTLNDISRQSGVAVSTIYQYFGNKEQLFLALTDSFNFKQSLENIQSALTGKQNGSLAELREAMLGVASAFLHAPLENVEIIRLFIAEVKRFPEIGVIYRQRLVAPGENLLAQFLEKQIERGIFRKVNTRQAASAFFGMFLNVVVTEYLFIDQELLNMPSEADVAMMVDIFLRGLLSPTQSWLEQPERFLS